VEEIRDSYVTISQMSEGEYKEKGSKFLAFAFPFDHVDDLEENMKYLKGLHPKARHFCYAYAIGIDQEDYRMNDDGEPSNTAGKPIFGQIKSHELTNILVVVIRYFGGTKLGASGLIQAYKEAANSSLDASEQVTKTIGAEFEINFTYEQMGVVLNAVKRLNFDILDKTFELEPSIKIFIKSSEKQNRVIVLKAALLEVSEDQVNVEEEIPWCKIIEKREIHV
jgi:uncharacterized YigZ family protein